jgi:hypothetical protein
MSKRNEDKGRLPPFVPIDKEMMMSPAWRALSMGARVLYMHLKCRWSFKGRNNGRIFLSYRDALKELGNNDRASIARWYRELEHYGFIVMTNPGGLGVDGKGRSPHWRLTEAEAPGGRNGDTWMLPTKDYNKWDGAKFRDDERKKNRFQKNRIPAGKTSQGGREYPARPGRENQPLCPDPGRENPAIGEHPPGREYQAISILTTPSTPGPALSYSTAPNRSSSTAPSLISTIADANRPRRLGGAGMQGRLKDWDVRQRALEFLGSGQKTVPEIVAGASIRNRNAANVLLHKLVGDGLIERIGRGLYKRVS